MRLKRFMINEEDVIQKGLNTDEPTAKQEYSEEEVNHYLAPIISALDALRQKGVDSEADEATYRDLQDKKKKWEEVKPGEPTGKTAAPEQEPEGDEAAAEKEAGQEEADAEKEAADKEKEDDKEAADKEKEDEKEQIEKDKEKK